MIYDSIIVTGSASITGSLNVIGTRNFSTPISISTLSVTSSQVNTFNTSHNGVSTRVYAGLATYPVLNYTGSGTGTGVMYGVYTYPTISSSLAGTNSRITLGGVFANAFRNSPNDLGTFSGNTIYGVYTGAGHTTTIFSGSITAGASAIRTNANNGKGTITTLRGVYNEVFVATNASATTASSTDAQGIYNTMTVGAGASTGLSTVTNAYGVQNVVTVGGGGGGTSTLTNYYGFYQGTPTVGSGGTLTNKYGLYFVDPNMPSYHAGTLLIGTTTDDSSGAKLQVSGAVTATGITISTGGGTNIANTVNIDTDGGGTARYYSHGTDSSTAGSHAWHNASSDGTVDNIVFTLASTGDATFSSLGTGIVYSNSGTLTNTDPSDSRLKNSINPLSHGLTEILKLEPKTFYYNSDDTKSSLKYGFIAQDVQLIMPDLVRAIGDGSDKLGLESSGIYVAMVNAIKEQQSQIQSLLTRIETLENK